MRYLKLFIPFALLAAVLTVGCGGGGTTTKNEPAAPAAKTASLSVTLGNMTIQAPKTVPAGPTDVSALNADSIVHEVVFIKTDTPAGKLPTDSTGTASEKGSVGEIGDVPPNLSKSTTINLTPGHYALICNLPGHYAAGMFTDLTVK